jgi:type III secretory pathway lipoprotein EscJ
MVRAAAGIAVAVAAAVAGCAPEVATPADQQRAVDRADGDRIAATLAALPGAVSANVVLRRSTRDPLAAAAAPTPAGAAVLIVIDDRADRAAVTADARALVHAAAPELTDAQTAVVLEVGAHRPELARVGPFTVEAGSRTPLRAALAACLLAILALAGYVAWRERARG